MKILSAAQIREADLYTIQNEPISSIDLMERAAHACVDWLFQNLLLPHQKIAIICGMGNNGGDGFAIARALHHMGFDVSCFWVQHKSQPSADCQENFQKLKQLGLSVVLLQPGNIDLLGFDVVIDALFGTGLAQPLNDGLEEVAVAISQSQAKVVAIDLPSGLFAEGNTEENLNAAVQAHYTLSFQTPKEAFFLRESAEKCGKVVVLPIQLSEKFLADVQVNKHHFEAADAKNILQPRHRFSHKGTHGHALMVGGAMGKLGAILMASKACLRAGVGLCSIQSPEELGPLLQMALPEAMLASKSEQVYAAMAIGPGMGKGLWAQEQLKQALLFDGPVVFDADAINLLAEMDSFQFPANSCITPHPKEFARLVGCDFHSDAARITAAKAWAIKHGAVVVLKQAITAICTPTGDCYFVTTGSPVLAKGGSGDVLTGIVVSLLAQGYPVVDAACLGAWILGTSGQLAAQKFGGRAVLSSDVIETIGKAFETLEL